MSHYLQWLHGSFYELSRCDSGIDSEDLFQTSVALLKLHALFGNTVVLSDMQIVDSHIMLRLFADASFRTFLKEHPGFLELSAWPEEGTTKFNYSISTSGLRRCITPGWVSAVFPVPETTQQFANDLLADGAIDLNKQLHDRGSAFNKVANRWPERKLYIEGILRGIDYFANSPHALVKVPPFQSQPSDMYKFLCEAFNYNDISSEDLAYLQKTKDFIDRVIEDPTDRGRQSLVWTKLDEQLKSIHPDYYIIKHTSHHAWNAAIEYGTAPECGSLGYLSRSAQIGYYLNTPTDVLIPVTKEMSEDSISALRRRIPLLINWDPATIPWDQIAKIVSETKEQALEFQNALSKSNDELIHYTLEKHLKAIANSVTQESSLRKYEWVWIFGPIIAFFVEPTTQSLLFGTGITGGTSILTHGILSVINNVRKYLITNTLRKPAERLIPTQHNPAQQ